MHVNLHDAKTHLSRYVEQALDGDEVVIARAGQPLMKLVPVSTTPRRRQLGFMRTKCIATADLDRFCTGATPHRVDSRAGRQAATLLPECGEPLGDGDQALNQPCRLSVQCG